MIDDIAETMEAIAADSALPEESRRVAGTLGSLERERRVYTFNPNDNPPEVALPIDDEFCGLHAELCGEGQRVASRSHVVFVGMARDIAGILPATIERLENIGRLFKRWSAVVVENDSTDGTKDILRSWEERSGGSVAADCRDLGYERLAGLEAKRVERYAEFRTRYRDIAASRFPSADYIVAVDLDPWGGYCPLGVLNSIGWMQRAPRAACMASTSLFQVKTHDGERAWLHYDQWAFRAYGFKPRWDRYFPLWLPPPGSPPLRVFSAFGALAVYRRDPFFAHAPASIDGDIEHVGLHRAMIEAGWEVYLNPSSRVVMHWHLG